MKSAETIRGAWVAAALCALVLAAAVHGPARAEYQDDETSEDIYDSCKDFSVSNSTVSATCNYENPNGSKTAATRGTSINLHDYVNWDWATETLSWGTSGSGHWGPGKCYSSSLSVATDSVTYKVYCNNFTAYKQVSITMSDKIENDGGYLKYNANR